MKMETWLALIPGDKIKTVGNVERTVEEKDGRIGWSDAHVIFQERGKYNMMMWEKVNVQ